MCEVLTIAEIRRRKEIEDRYQASIDAWRGQRDFAIAMLDYEFSAKCVIAEQKRNEELLQENDWKS
jgi:hypothetical protein